MIDNGKLEGTVPCHCLSIIVHLAFWDLNRLSINQQRWASPGVNNPLIILRLCQHDEQSMCYHSITSIHTYYVCDRHIIQIIRSLATYCGPGPPFCPKSRSSCGDGRDYFQSSNWSPETPFSALITSWGVTWYICNTNIKVNRVKYM